MRTNLRIICAAIAGASLIGAVALAAAPSSADASNPTIVYSQHVTDPGYTYQDPCTSGYYLTSVHAVTDDGNASMSQTDAYSPTAPSVFLGISAPFTVYSTCAYYGTVTPLPEVSPSASASPAASASASASVNPSSAPAGYVQPGTVGYLGATSALTVYQPGGAVAPGCSWQSYGMRCGDNNVTLDHVWVKGGIYWTGTGTLKITNSIVQGGSGSEWYAVLGHPSSSGALPGSIIDVENSTVGWLPGKTYPSGFDVAPIWSLYGNEAIIANADDLSGMPQGIDPTGNSVVTNNWIHGLVQNGTSSSPTHLDGMYSQGGGNILMQGNYVDTPARSDTTAALFIQDRGSTDTGITIKSNYLAGGAYVLRNQTGINVDVEGNTFGNSGLYGYVGDLSGYPGTYGTWTGNVDSSGNTIPKP